MNIYKKLQLSTPDETTGEVQLKYRPLHLYIPVIKTAFDQWVARNKAFIRGNSTKEFRFSSKAFEDVTDFGEPIFEPDSTLFGLRCPLVEPLNAHVHDYPYMMQLCGRFLRVRCATADAAQILLRGLALGCLPGSFVNHFDIFHSLIQKKFSTEEETDILKPDNQANLDNKSRQNAEALDSLTKFANETSSERNMLPELDKVISRMYDNETASRHYLGYLAGDEGTMNLCEELGVASSLCLCSFLIQWLDNLFASLQFDEESRHKSPFIMTLQYIEKARVAPLV